MYDDLNGVFVGSGKISLKVSTKYLYRLFDKKSLVIHKLH